jgi:RimJ/RimL family protein N-acetyltransferase
MHIGKTELIAETPRLLIRSLSFDDVSVLAEILGDPEVMKYSVRGVCDEDATRKFVEWCVTSYKSHGIGPWAIVDKATSSFIGFCGVGPELVGSVREINLGYRLARRFWGRGLATESVRAVLAYAFGIKACQSVVVIVEPEHVASLRVAEKSGFRRFQEVVFHDKPVRVYRLTRADWAQRHDTSFQSTPGRDAGML